MRYSNTGWERDGAALKNPTMFRQYGKLTFQANTDIVDAGATLLGEVQRDAEAFLKYDICPTCSSYDKDIEWIVHIVAFPV